MAVSVKDLLSPLNKKDVLDDVYAILQDLGLTTTALQPGEPIPTVLSAVVQWAIDSVWNPFILPALQAQFGDYASGDWLTLTMANLWNRPRIQELQGTMTVVLENRGSFSGTTPTIRAKSSVTGKTYTSTTSGSLTAWTGSGPYPTVSLTFEADIAGPSANLQTGQLDVYPVPLAAGPINVFVQSNTVCLGAAQETDAAGLARARAAVGEMSSAPPRAAFLAVALDPTGSLQRRGLPVPWPIPYVPSVARVRIVEAASATCTVYLASTSGPAAGDTSTPGTDVFNVNFALQLLAGGVGVTITTLAATSHTINLGTVTLTVSASSNVTAAEAVANATSAIDTFFANLPIGGARTTAGGTGYVYAAKLHAVLAAPDYVDDVVIAFTDTALAVGDVAVLGTFTPVANIVDQS
jgi:hypothetical protein